MKTKGTILSILCAICLLIPSVYADNEDDVPSVFDSRNYGIVTPVRDQGYTSLCWAYAAAGASEISVLKSGTDKTATADNLCFSPHQIGYSRHSRGVDPMGNTTGENSGISDWSNQGGGIKYAAALLSQWCGPISATLPYNANGWENAMYKLESAVSVNGKNLADSEEARIKMKKAIMKYGAVTFSYNNVREVMYYNPKGENSSSPHACVIIGWDDTIPADKFGPGETKTDGGWLVKNSYLSHPYFYLSYEVGCEQIYAFHYAAKDKYDFNYFYDASVEDSGMGSLLKVKRAANIYEAKHDGEVIKAVSVGTVGENINCTVNIYNVDKREKVCSEEAEFEYGGYNCIELKNPVRIHKGERFAVETAVENDDNSAYITLSFNESESYIYRPSGWIKSVTARIKAFTKKEAYAEFVDKTSVRAFAAGGEKQLVIASYDDKCIKNIHVETADFSAEKTVNLPRGWSGSEYRVFLWDNLMPVCIGDILKL